MRRARPCPAARQILLAKTLMVPGQRMPVVDVTNVALLRRAGRPWGGPGKGLMPGETGRANRRLQGGTAVLRRNERTKVPFPQKAHPTNLFPM